MKDMITEDYVSFETAKLLREKGFNEKTFAHYNENRELTIGSESILWNRDYVVTDVCAPTLQMARKWLDKMKGMHINIIFKRVCDKGYWCKGHWTWGDYEYDSYEQALEDAIKYCLKKI